VRTRRGPPSHRAICGLTASNNRDVKQAALKIARHPVMENKVRRSLADSIPHYVLLSYGQPQGPGGNSGFAATALQILKGLSHDWDGAFNEWKDAGNSDSRSPRSIPENRFWYTYWKGHLEKRFANNPLQEDGFAPILGH
jgi:hypothetical protein